MLHRGVFCDQKVNNTVVWSMAKCSMSCSHVLWPNGNPVLIGTWRFFGEMAMLSMEKDNLS